jgi:hypothetical protein
MGLNVVNAFLSVVLFEGALWGQLTGSNAHENTQMGSVSSS